MTQEGQALPSPTPPENPAETNTATTTTTTTDPPAETYNQAEQDKLGSNDEIRDGKQQEEIREGEEEAQWETHGKGEGREGVTDEREGVELKEENLDGSGEEDQHTEGGAEGEREAMRGEGCIYVEVSSAGEEAACEEEGMKEEGKENEEKQLPSEDPQQAERLVLKIVFTVALW